MVKKSSPSYLRILFLDKALSAWRKNPNLDTQAKLEAEVIVLKIHAEQTEIALEEETALIADEDIQFK